MVTAVRKPTSILDRYNPQADGGIIVNVAVRAINDLYNCFDIKTSYSKWDLDEDFVDYLIDSVKEIRCQPFVFRITLENPVDTNGETKIQTSINCPAAEPRGIRKSKRHRGGELHPERLKIIFSTCGIEKSVPRGS